MDNIFTTGSIVRPEGKNVVSYSQYSLYKTCPHKWKTTYVDKNKIPEHSIDMTFGTAFHKTVQTYLDVLYNQSVKEANNLNINNMLLDNIREEYSKGVLERGGEHYTTKLKLNEYYSDGCDILDYLLKKRTNYFPTRNIRLIGTEVPLLVPTCNENVYFLAYIDILMEDIENNMFLIKDIKTSGRGWDDSKKKDDIRISQLRLYKSFLSKQYSIDLKNIDVEYMIVRRKIMENTLYTIPRLQLFKPANGSVSIKKVQSEFDSFITECFNPDGTYNVDRIYNPIAGNNEYNCKYCRFKTDYNICPKENRIHY